MGSQHCVVADMRALALLLALASAAAWTAPRRPRPASLALAAKGKKGKKGKKGGGQKKQSGMEWALNFEVMPYDSVGLRQLAEESANAFQARTGTALVDGGGDVAKALWAAPAAVLIAAPPSDDTPSAHVGYANEAGCEFLGGKHGDVIGAATELATALEKGYDGKYEKKVGGRTMRGAKRWQIDRMAVVDGALATEVVGVGYVFDSWLLEDGRVGEPGGVVSEPPADPVEVAAKIEAQGALIRDLKETQGLGNKSPEVVDAVAELLRLKAILEPPEDAA